MKFKWRNVNPSLVDGSNETLVLNRGENDESNVYSVKLRRKTKL
ncbi:hypothetical protein JCM19235_3693 [Vibrio maritimus]|uniref:Uncharacterized protein n=1 Tax=Vibrio maritimus TaxID=990268 RepID=A0A090RZH1_9VIBR|nr:hypothetical protein JCM19235_3693 [Vibrio maritimus]